MPRELPFDDSRRLTGGNLFFAASGAVLEIVEVEFDEALLDAWRSKVERAGARLGWADRQSVARRHASGASLAIAAPCDQLFLATEVNEWALCAALVERDPVRWARLEEALVVQAADAQAPDEKLHLKPAIDESAAFARFERLAALETQPKLRALLETAAARGLAHVLDESELTLGTGVGGRSFSLAALPEVASVPWAEMRDIPTAIVTGSNGKTTTVRLLAACARAHGWRAGYNCTDGVFLDDESLAARRLFRARRRADGDARAPRRGGHSRNRARRHFAPRNRDFAGRRRGRDQRELGSFRRVRHP